MENKENELQKQLKPEVRLNGQLYRLRFDLGALEEIEKEFGGMREAFKSMSSGEGGRGMIESVRKMFVIMANCWRDYNGMKMDVTGEELGRHCSIAKLTEVSEAIRAAMDEGMKSETQDGGEASDKKENPLDKEYNEKNG